MCEVLVDENIRKGRGERAAIFHGDERLTYNRLLESVSQAANAFTDLGLDIEHRYLVLLHDCPEFVCAFLGGMRLGAVPVCVNPMLNEKDIRFMLEDSRSRLLVTGTEHYRKLAPMLDDLRHLKAVIVVPREGEDLSWVSALPRVHGWRELISCYRKSHTPARTFKNDIALWLYSSGSTGRPKGTVHLHHDILTTTDLYARQVLGIDEASVVFSASKLFFAYGLGNSLTFPLRHGGATVLYPGKPTPEAVFSVLERHRPTHFFGVPTLFASMLAASEQKRPDLSFLKIAVSAGEALQPAIFDAWKRAFGQELVEGIGSTELLHIFISNRPGEVRPGSSGKAVPGYEARIVDDQGKEVPDGTVGNLLVKGESMAVLYWGRHKKSAKVMLGDWLSTGDMYLRDPDGYYYYQGRSDDMLKVGGIWVSPVEVENSVMELPEVFECAVIGHPGEDGLVKPKAYVVLKPGFEPSGELVKRIQEHVKTSTARYKYPRWVEFVEELPKTATGKIQRFRLRT
ncbi:MAG: benzoate-CoA ligase family protein [Euryarchaeota archaeon]|nr:benzoate-CoA ligase family protein [Euryarchaeota archaeon]